MKCNGTLDCSAVERLPDPDRPIPVYASAELRNAETGKPDRALPKPTQCAEECKVMVKVMTDKKIKIEYGNTMTRKKL
jgi:hypothetical protein